MSDERPLTERLADAEKRASKLAHDLNNLVSVVLGYAALLVDLVPSDSPAKRMAEEVQEAAERAAAMSRDLLEVRREQRALEGELRDMVQGGGAKPEKDRADKADRRKRAVARTVLVVEDDASVRRLAESILKRGGYDVLLAAESSQAYATIEKHPEAIDLLLTDVVLPGDSGSDLVAKALKVRPKMLVLYMSGYSPEGLPDDGPFLPKPFTADVLLARVKALLAEAGR